MTALTDAPTVYVGTEYGIQGVVTRDVNPRPLMDALATVEQWPGCYRVVVREGAGEWRPLFVLVSA